MLIRITLIIFSFLMASSSIANDDLISSSSTNEEANLYLQALPQWAMVLKNHVDDQGRIDFESLSKDTSNLDAFVSAIGQVSPSSNPSLFETKEKVLAYHINAYNALAMKGIIDRKIPKNFSSTYKKASFFVFRKNVIGGKKRDLRAYENKVIRMLGEPRVHFVLNCMVKDCPRLPQKPFYAKSLEADLQNAAVEFFTRKKHTQVDDVKQELRLSGIMKFYTEDYVKSGKKQDLIAYVNQYRTDKVPEDYRVSFIKYDWTVNKQP